MARFPLWSVASLLALSSVCFPQSDWLMVNANVGRTSCVREETQLKPPLKLLRTIPTIKAGFLSVTSRELFVGVYSSTPNGCWAYDFQTGAILWNAAVTGSGAMMNFVPTVLDQVVLLGGQNGNGLLAVDRTTGTQRWLKPIGNLMSRSPVFENDRIYIIGDSLYCLNAADGKTLWNYPIVKQGTPALDATTLYATDYTRLVALNKATGAFKWEVPNNGFWILAVDDDFVYTNNDSTLHARRKTDGAPVWSYPYSPGSSGRNMNPVVITPATVILSKDMPLTKKGEIVALNRSTGSFLWRYSVPTSTVDVATAANGTIYFADWDVGHLFALDEQSGAELLVDSSAMYQCQPVVANHQLVVGTSKSVRVFVSSPVKVDDAGGSALPSPMQAAVSPNPCSDEAWITFRIGERTPLRLEMYDALGRRIETLAEGVYDQGVYRVLWTPQGTPPGVYYYALTTPHATAAGKVLHRK
jgi:outer membrane protein assembly factor BamB